MSADVNGEQLAADAGPYRQPMLRETRLQIINRVRSNHGVFIPVRICGACKTLHGFTSTNGVLMFVSSCDCSGDLPAHPVPWENLDRFLASRTDEQIERILEKLPIGPLPTLDGYIAEHIDFSLEALGPGERRDGLLRHLESELQEIRDASDDEVLGEWVDVIILGIDGAQRTGANASQIAAALVAKLKRNKARTWPDWRNVPDGQPIEHVRTPEEIEAKRLQTPPEPRPPQNTSHPDGSMP